MIEPQHPKLAIVEQCRLIGISRSAYYGPLKGESPLNLSLMRLIDQQFLDTPWYGSRQMARYLRRLGHVVGRKRVRRLMAKTGLEPIYQRPRTTVPHPEHKIWPYLLRNLTIDRPDQVWCADITYIPMRRGFLYLVAIMDWATRRVLAWRLSNSMEVEFCLEALEEAPSRKARGPIRSPGDLQHRPGKPVHEPPLHRAVDRRRREDLHGRPRPLARQCLHRAAMAVVEVRMRLPQCLRNRHRSPCRDRQVVDLLQRRTPAFGARWQNTRGSPHGQRRHQIGGVTEPRTKLIRAANLSGKQRPPLCGGWQSRRGLAASRRRRCRQRAADQRR